VVSERISSV
nr:Chain B, peptide from 5-hydroxytryptamine receptor 2C [Rattus norvegicus]